MAKTKVSEWSSTPASNTDVGGIDINEGCAPSGINNAIRDVMAQIKDMQTGADGDNFVVGGNLTVTGTTTLSTDLPVASGGTGASTAADARTNLGLGTIATQASNNVTITGGSITGITDLAVADGGTGASTLTGVVIGNGTSAMTAVAPGTSGNLLTSNGTAWTSAALNFDKLLSSSGYQKLPSGLIIQWFSTSESSTQGSFTANYPIAFPNAFLAASCSTTNTGASSNADLYIQFVSSTTTTITLYRQAVNNFAAIGAMVIAIGY
jgi:hypothetical protein